MAIFREGVRLLEFFLTDELSRLSLGFLPTLSMREVSGVCSSYTPFVLDINLVLNPTFGSFQVLKDFHTVSLFCQLV